MAVHGTCYLVSTRIMSRNRERWAVCVEDTIKPLLSYADVTKGKQKFVTWESELAKKATKQNDKQLLEEVQRDLIK